MTPVALYHHPTSIPHGKTVLYCHVGLLRYHVELLVAINVLEELPSSI